MAENFFKIVDHKPICAHMEGVVTFSDEVEKFMILEELRALRRG